MNFVEKLKKRNNQSLRQDDDTKKILAQIEDRIFQVLQNRYWIISLFESVPMDKVKTNDFYV